MKRFQLSFILLTITAAAILPRLAQAQIQYQRPTRDLHSRLSIRSTMIFGADVTFSNLGEVGYPVDDDDNVDFVFNDGYIDLNDPDNTRTSLFAFDMDNAEYNQFGLVTSFSLNRYRAEASEQTFSNDSDSSYGWEIAYQYEFGKASSRIRFGFFAGFAFNNMDFSLKQSVSGDFYVQTATVQLNGPQISYEEGGTYTGSNEGPSINIDTDMQFGPEQTVTQGAWGADDVEVPSDVYVDLDLNGALASLRIGPVIQIKIARKWSFQGSVGIAGIFYDRNFRVSETLRNTLLDTDYSVTETTSQHDWMFGYYSELGLRYQATEQVSFYSSFQWSAAKKLTSGSAEGVFYEVDLGKTQFFSIGIERVF